MKKGLIIAATAVAPFLLVWIAAIFTAFSFNPIHVFQNGNFWGLSIIYWLLWVCLSPLIIEMVDTTVSSKKS